MSWSFFALLSYLYIIVDVFSNSDICIWQRTEESTTYVNGFYIYNDNDGYYEKKDTECSDNSLFLYFPLNDAWHIGPNLGDTDNYIAICNSDLYVENPADCGPNWEFAPNGILDSSIEVFEGECPNVNECDKLFVSYTTFKDRDDCSGYFSAYKENDDWKNVFYKASLNDYKYLYFSNNDFRWICTNSLNDITKTGKCQNLNISETVEAYSIDPVWYDMELKQWRKYPWSSNENKTAYINCQSFAPTESPTPSPTINYSLNTEELQVLRKQIKQAFDASGDTKPLLASVVRLVFNDCIGPKEGNEDTQNIYDNTPNYIYNTICDGCINLKDTFHSGLYELAIEPLDEIFMDSTNDWDTKMSLADFWMAVGTVAIEYGIELSGIGDDDDDDDMDEYPMFFGRTDCSNAPNININETTPKDLDALLTNTWDEILYFFENDLNFTLKEVITMFGAHTLGTKHVQYSGFEGKWTDNVYVFDNNYFSMLLNNEWTFYEENNWKRQKEGYSMLNSDIQCGYDIDDKWDASNQEYQCVVNTNSDDSCPQRTETKGIIQSYASNNQLFLDNFKKIWIKIVTMGYDDEKLREIIDTTTADIAYQSRSNVIIIMVMSIGYCLIF